MSDGGSGDGIVRTADPVQSPVTTPSHRRRRRTYLVAVLVVSVAPLGAGLVAVGVSYSVAGDLDSHVWTSTDARTWTQVPDQPAWRGGGDQALSGVCPLPGGGLVAVGYHAFGTQPEGLGVDVG